MNPVARTLILIGIALIIAGTLFHFFSKWGIPFGKLPGDIAIEKSHFRFYFPIVSSIIASVILSLAIQVIRRFMK